MLGSYLLSISLMIATPSYPDGGYRNYMGVAHYYCYELLLEHNSTCVILMVCTLDPASLIPRLCIYHMDGLGTRL